MWAAGGPCEEPDGLQRRGVQEAEDREGWNGTRVGDQAAGAGDRGFKGRRQAQPVGLCLELYQVVEGGSRLGWGDLWPVLK